VVYAFGEKIGSIAEHELFRPHINAAALTYEMAHDPEFEDLVSTFSHLTGRKINRFTHIHQSADDLVKKVKMLRAIAQRTGSCFQRCVGFDGINALYSTTYDIDHKLGTVYHVRIKKYVQYLQDTDKMVAGSMTDPKGDRGLPPGRQQDPDMCARGHLPHKIGLAKRLASLDKEGKERETGS
jgi:4-hydroxybutyryl-CoA dehydratase/vinylacetyl-CoA-Delta-isomerase